MSVDGTSGMGCVCGVAGVVDAGVMPGTGDGTAGVRLADGVPG